MEFAGAWEVRTGQGRAGDSQVSPLGRGTRVLQNNGAVHEQLLAQ